MREIVLIHVGQCGVDIGSKFWENITDEQGIEVDGYFYGASDSQLEKADVYFC